MTPLTPRYESQLFTPDLRSSVETALHELIGKCFSRFKPVDDKKLVYEVQTDSNDQALSIQFRTGDEVLTMRRRGQNLKRKVVNVILTGKEKIDEIKLMIVSAIESTLSFVKRKNRIQLRRRKARYDCDFVRFDRGCLCH